MFFEHVAIASVAHVDAPVRVASSQIEDEIAPTLERLQIRPGLLEGLSGIKARRFFESGVPASYAATEAAKKALEIADIPREKLGIIVNTSVCRDFLEPSTACIVHGNLGLGPECRNFDVANACLGFMDGMEIVSLMIERGQIDYGMVVDGEHSRPPIEATLERLKKETCDSQTFRNNFATLTLGSGGAAMILGRREKTNSTHRFRGGVTLSATKFNHLCRGQMDGMETDTKGLLQAGVELAKQTFHRAERELGWKAEDLDELILHQVSKVHTEQVTSAMGLKLDKVLKIFPEFGNIGPAAVPITLSKSIEAGRINTGDRVALMGIGSGLNCSMYELVW